MDKKTLRKELIARRDNMNSRIWWSSSSLIQRNVLKSTVYKLCDVLLIYSDYHNEVETISVIEDALVAGKEVYLPKIINNPDSFDQAMEFYRIYSTLELMEGYKGIKEPIEDAGRSFSYELNKSRNCLMIVPGVAFDKNKYRLGYGKGFYDKYLCDKPAILKIGIAFDFQVISDLPTEENDVVLDYLITESTPHREIEKYSYK